MSSHRFTAWLSERERDELRKRAKRHECSENLIVRMAVRQLLFDEEVPKYLRPEGTSNEARSVHR